MRTNTQNTLKLINYSMRQIWINLSKREEYIIYEYNLHNQIYLNFYLKIFFFLKKKGNGTG